MAIDEATIGVSNDNGCVTITAGGSLTFLNATEFGEQIAEAASTADSVTVDLRPADFIDTQILQDLGRAGVKLLGRDKRLRLLLDADAYPLRVIMMSGYEAIMDVDALPGHKGEPA